jgi:hypothetical protein
MTKRAVSNARYRNGCCSPRDPCPAHRMIAVKYRRARKPYLIGDERAEELDRLAVHRYGDTLPDNAEGERFAFVMAHHIGEPNRVRAYLDEAAPWFDEDDADKLTKGVAKKRYRWNADKLASKEWLAVSYAERQALGLKTIGAFDMPKKARRALWRERYRDRQRAINRAYQEQKRREHGMTPWAQSLSRIKPWEAAGISRRTWYRKRGTKVSSPYTLNKRPPHICAKPPSKPRRHKRAAKEVRRRLSALPPPRRPRQLAVSLAGSGKQVNADCELADPQYRRQKAARRLVTATMLAFSTEVSPRLHAPAVAVSAGGAML